MQPASHPAGLSPILISTSRGVIAARLRLLPATRKPSGHRIREERMVRVTVTKIPIPFAQRDKKALRASTGPGAKLLSRTRRPHNASGSLGHRHLALRSKPARLPAHPLHRRAFGPAPVHRWRDQPEVAITEIHSHGNTISRGGKSGLLQNLGYFANRP
jgi:hypothetical protein